MDGRIVNDQREPAATGNRAGDSSANESPNSSNRRSYDPDSSDLDSQGSAKGPAQSHIMHQPEHGDSQLMVVNNGIAHQ